MTETGRRLGRYRLEELLGQGGMAEVWRARDERLGRTVAVKVILTAHARDAHFRERFQKEAQLVASLDHPNILPVYDFGDEAGLPYLVMPYLEGGTLRDRMVGAPIPFGQAVSWIRQLGDALDAAHEAGILHRDVKPANVLIRRDDRLALADFGIAKMLQTSTGLTATGMVVGTPIYMAPEQAQGKPATPASDRYALGVLAYEILSGRPPFDGESALALMHQHVTSPAPPLSSSVHGLPAGLDPVFERALAKEPERRPPSCRTFATELLAFVPTGSVSEADRATTPWAAMETSPTLYEATPKRVGPRATERDPELTSRPTISTSPQPSRRTVLGIAAAAVGVVVLAGVWLLSSRPEPAPLVAAAAVPTVAVPTAVPTASPAPPPAGPAPAEEKAVEPARPGVSAPERDATSGAAPAPPAVPPVAPEPVRVAAPRDVEPPREPGGTPPPPPGAAGDLRALQARLDPVLRGGTRPTREDFQAAARAAREAEARDPGSPGARALELYALGGIAYLDRRDDEAVRQLLAAQSAAGKFGAWELRVLRVAAGRGRGAKEAEGWELALAYGDARREADALLAKDLARDPADPRALLGRAALRRMERRSDEAIADATAVHEGRPPGFLGAVAAELLAEEHLSRGDFEEAARWYREAAIPQNPLSAHAGWEGGRILEERLGRAGEARELYAAACRAGNRKACAKSGDPAPRPRLFPRRRAP